MRGGWLLLAALAVCAPALAGDFVVIVDPGHGGARDSGSQAKRTLSAANNATSPSGLLEKDLTLALSLEVREQVRLLAPAHPQTRLTCLLTRETDVNPDFAERTAFCMAAEPIPAAIFSIHFNASDKHNALGTLAVVEDQTRNQNYEADMAFAQALVAATSQAVRVGFPASKARAPISDGHLHGGVGSNFFWQLARAPRLRGVPKCFLEVEFIDRKDTEAALLNNRAVAFPAIARAIATFLYAHCEMRGASMPPPR